MAKESDGAARGTPEPVARICKAAIEALGAGAVREARLVVDSPDLPPAGPLRQAANYGRALLDARTLLLVANDADGMEHVVELEYRAAMLKQLLRTWGKPRDAAVRRVYAEALKTLNTVRSVLFVRGAVMSRR